METNPALGLLGLARRAGKLACGEDAVREMVAAGKCRAIFLADDVGEATRRKVMRYFPWIVDGRPWAMQSA